MDVQSVLSKRMISFPQLEIADMRYAPCGAQGTRGYHRRDDALAAIPPGQPADGPTRILLRVHHPRVRRFPKPPLVSGIGNKLKIGRSPEG